jgi:hypothetical protein
MRRLLAQHRDEVDRWRADLGDSPDELTWDVSDRRNLLEAMRAYDPRARFPEELTVRLLGETARGAMDLELTPLLEGVRRSFVEGPGLNMALAGVSAGSTVLHFRPSETVDPEVVGEDEAVPVDATVADTAGREYVAMVAAAEAGQDVRRWTRMLRGLEQAVDALESENLAAQIRWSSVSGAITVAQLTERGRNNVRRLSEGTEHRRRRPVSGRVTELRETGWVKLKTGAGRTSPVHEVRLPSEVLLGLHLELGQQAHFMVVETVTTDHLARESGVTLEFERVLSAGEAAEMLPGFEES